MREAAAKRRVLPYGHNAVLVECQDTAEAMAVARALDHRADVAETVPGARTVLVRCHGPVHDQLVDDLAKMTVSTAAQEPLRTVRIPVIYDGEDLAEVAKHCQLTPAEVIAAHTSQAWQVAFCGFAPGFAYLQGDNPSLTVPRRAAPRTSVPSGAVGLADHWSGIYPRSAPGGWQLIGHTDITLFDPVRQPPALLHPGVVVRFVDATATEQAEATSRTRRA